MQKITKSVTFKQFWLLNASIAFSEIAFLIVIAPIILSLIQHHHLTVGHSFRILDTIGLAFTLMMLSIGRYTNQYVDRRFALCCSYLIALTALVLLHFQTVPFCLYLGLSLFITNFCLYFINILKELGEMMAALKLHRDSGFSYYHIAILIGQILGPLIGGAIIAHGAFHWCLEASMLFYVCSGLSILCIINSINITGRTKEWLPFIVSLSLTNGLVVTYFAMPSILTALMLMGAILWLFVESIRHGELRKAQLPYLMLFFFCAICLRLDEGFVLIFVKNIVNTQLPAAWILSLNAILSMAFCLLFARLWQAKPFDSDTKLILGFFALAISFLVPVFAPGQTQIPLSYFIVFILIQAIGEALFLPVIMASYYHYCPTHNRIQSLSLFFAIIGICKFIAAKLGGVLTPRMGATALDGYREAFLLIGMVCFTLLISFVFYCHIKKQQLKKVAVTKTI